MTQTSSVAQRAAPTASPARRDDIQGLRALAVLMVVAFHAGLPVPGGFAGVDVFFVISGFVITAMLQREFAATGGIRLRSFYARRLKRLTPALALTVTVTMILTAAIVSPLGPQQNAALTGIGAMLLVANLVIANTTGAYFSPSADTNPLLNVWSLSVEEQFYLAFPLLLLGCWLLARAHRRLRAAPAAIVLTIAAISFALSLIDEASLAFPGSRDALGFYSPVPRAWEFAAGALIALILRRGREWRRPAWLPVVSAVAGLAGIAASLMLIDATVPFPGPWTLLPVAATVLLIVAGQLDPANAVSRLLSTAPLVKVGDWSYSLYLWHWPVIVLATTLWPNVGGVGLAAAAVSFAPAILSYRFVEEPLRRRRYSRRAFVLLAVISIGTPIAVSSAILVGADAGYGNATIRSYQVATRTHIGTSCTNTDRLLPGATIACSFNTNAGGAPVYLVGDSHADHVSDAVVEAARTADRPVHSRIAPACQLFDTYIAARGQAPVDHCRQYFTDTMAWLSSAPPGTVVISTSWKPFWSPDFEIGPTRQAMSSIPAEKIDFFAAGISDTIAALKAAGHEVVLVDDVPSLLTDDWEYAPTECALPLLASRACDKVLPLSAAKAQITDVQDRIDAVAATTGSRTVELLSSVCTAAGCASRQGDLVVYADSNHLSADMALTLADEFLPALAP